MRRLVIRAFHVDQVAVSDTAAYEDGLLTIPTDFSFDRDRIRSYSIDIVKPGDHDRPINTIMDIIPISAKVLGRLGEGITHTCTGVYLLLTGADEKGRQMNEFGASDGNMQEKLMLDRAGTPASTDLIIHLDVVLNPEYPFDRQLVNAAFELSDRLIAPVRDVLRGLDGRTADESHEFYDTIRPDGIKVALIKQIAGQGAMYDNRVLPSEPSGMDGISIIDMQNMPIVLSPNEYRDGALRALV